MGPIHPSLLVKPSLYPECLKSQPNIFHNPPSNGLIHRVCILLG